MTQIPHMKQIAQMEHNHTQRVRFHTLIGKGLFLFFLLLVAPSVYAATLSITPATGVYTAGQTFTARVVVNTSGKKINAAEGTLTFNPSELSVVRVQKGSVFNLWTADPTFSNTAGTISFSGGTPGGYSGGAGTVISITFRSKGSGNTKLQFRDGAVLAADGRGTNILTGMTGASYTIAAKEVVPEPETIQYIAPANTPDRPTIQSETHPDPDKWYAQKTASLKWELPTDVIAIRTLLDENSGSIPTKVYDPPISSITLDDLDEGIQYFHLQFKNKEGWGKVAHYRLAVDSQQPSLFEISLPEDADMTNPVQTLLLKTEDITSAVTRFTIQIDGGEAYEYIDQNASGTVTLPPLDPGRHAVIIEAFDQAGNSLIDTFSFTILAFDKPRFTEYPSEIPEDVIPVIKGITRPNAQVQVRIKKVGTEAQERMVQSNESGEFVFIPDGRLPLGVYELSAVAVDQYGAQSEESDVIRIAVQKPGYLRLGSFVVSFLSVLIPAVSLVLLLVLLVWFVILKLRRMRQNVRKESAEVHALLQKRFEQLRSVLDTHVEKLTSTRKTGKLTKAEKALVDALRKELQVAENRLTKEIEDVEDIVD